MSLMAASFLCFTFNFVEGFAVLTVKLKTSRAVWLLDC
jgi:hypothetical protein